MARGQVEIELREPGRRPESEQASFYAGETVRLVVDEAPPPLRRYLLRGGDRKLSAPGERTALWLRMPERANDPIRVLQIDRDVAGNAFILAEGDLQVPLEQDALLWRRSELVFQKDGVPAVKLLLRLVDSRLPQAMAIGEQSGGLSADEEEIDEPDWEIPGLYESTIKPLFDRLDALVERIVQKTRVPPALLRTLATIAIVLALLGYSGYQRGVAKSSAAAAEAAETALEQTEAASTDSASDAASCRLELAQLRRDLLQPEQARRMVLDAVLNRTLARAAVTAAVPADGETEAAMQRAEHDRKSLVLRAEELLAGVSSEPATSTWLAERLEHASVFEGALPEHAILWHPRPDERQDAGLAVWGKAGGSLRGPWGLGERPLMLIGQFRGEVGADSDLGDLRLQVEWSRETLHKGLLSVREVLLGRRIGGRLAVPPEQVHLWTIAIWHAWNELPPKGLQGGVDECVRLLLAGAAEGQAGEPGQAVLPSVIEIFDEEDWTVPLARSAACPWRKDLLVDGVTIAMSTVAETASVREDSDL